MPPVFIAGMHRSGTSWVARALHDAGLHLGDDLVGAEPSNPYGHFEDEHVVALHDEALAEQGLTWKSSEPPGPFSEPIANRIASIVTERNSTGRPWGIKDPRLCLFLPDWLAAAPDGHVLIVIRRPDEVVASLRQRHARRWVDTRHVDSSDVAFWQDPDLGVRLWVHYYEQLLLAVADITSPQQVLCFNWNAADASATQLLDSIGSAWGIGLQPMTTSRDANLGSRAPAAIEVRDPSLITKAEHIWSQLRQLPASHP